MVQDVEHPGHDGWGNNLVLDLRGNPDTVSIDLKQFDSGPIASECGTAIALDMSYNPQLAWYDGTETDLKYAVR